MIDGCLVEIIFIYCNVFNGLRWRDAPTEYGPQKTHYNRWKRWSDKGIFAWKIGPNDGGFGHRSGRRKDGRERRDLSGGASHGDRFGRRKGRRSPDPFVTAV